MKATINNSETNFLIDTGAEVSLISADIPGLIIKESPVPPISITHQPIVIKGEAEVVLKMGSLNTTWKFLVVENLTESVIGADFIEKHHNDSWGVKDKIFWLDDLGIPLVNTKEVRTFKEYNLCPVVAGCTVELPARHQILVSLRTQDRTTHDGIFESHKTPGGVLPKKGVVQPKRDGSFLVQAVNLNPQPVTLFKNQKIETLSSFDEVLNNSSDSDRQC